MLGFQKVLWFQYDKPLNILIGIYYTNNPSYWFDFLQINLVIDFTTEGRLTTFVVYKWRKVEVLVKYVKNQFFKVQWFLCTNKQKSKGLYCAWIQAEKLSQCPDQPFLLEQWASVFSNIEVELADFCQSIVIIQ